MAMGCTLSCLRAAVGLVRRLCHRKFVQSLDCQLDGSFCLRLVVRYHAHGHAGPPQRSSAALPRAPLLRRSAAVQLQAEHGGVMVACLTRVWFGAVWLLGPVRVGRKAWSAENRSRFGLVLRVTRGLLFTTQMHSASVGGAGARSSQRFLIMHHRVHFRHFWGVTALGS